MIALDHYCCHDCENENQYRASKALADRFEPEIDKVKRRLLQIDTEIAANRNWGAATSVLLEERNHIASHLMRLAEEENK